MHSRHLLIVFAATLGTCSILPAATAPSSWGGQTQHPLQVIQTIEANFPPGLSGRGVTHGEVRAVLNVNAEGRLVDFLVTSYTHRELALELTGLLRVWEYKPAMLGRDPINARSEMTFAFSDTGSIVSVQPFENPIVTSEGSMAPRMISAILAPNQLDEPLKPVHVVAPRHPGSAVGGGSATLEFYVDTEGKPRLTAVTAMTHEALGRAAVQAVEQWRFAPPTHRGRPTAVRVVQEFKFPTPPPAT
jgi:TonB family protein